VRTAGRALVLGMALTVMSPLLSAYYHYIFFASGTGPYAPLAAHFDLNAIKDNTVQYFVSDQAPTPLMPGDNLTAIYSQIRQAAEVWNGVGTSSLRLHFGGTRNMATQQTVPGIDVVFDDNMPPGIIAQTTLTFPSDLTFLSAKGTTFVPILRSKLQLRKDLTAAGYQQSSYTDAFFMTLVHEFGHTLGLQHTFTSATMSTAITRATTRGAPLAADDVSGISLLYPAGGYAASTGSITGQVFGASSGAGINLASVVALSTSGVAVSGMTRPDGTYEIDGIPPGQYYIYAHPLPPAQTGEGTPANIVPPADPQKDSFAANTGFVTQFFPGTQDWTQAAPAVVGAGSVVKNVNFAVAPSGGPAVYAMETYGYPQGVAIPTPPFVPKTRNGLVFYANGATVNNQSAIAPGLTASIIGSAASIEPGSLQYFSSGFLLAWVDTADIKIETPVALAVRLNGDLYVLPAAFTVVPGGASRHYIHYGGHRSRDRHRTQPAEYRRGRSQADQPAGPCPERSYWTRGHSRRGQRADRDDGIAGGSYRLDAHSGAAAGGVHRGRKRRVDGSGSNRPWHRSPDGAVDPAREFNVARNSARDAAT